MIWKPLNSGAIANVVNVPWNPMEWPIDCWQFSFDDTCPHSFLRFRYDFIGSDASAPRNDGVFVGSFPGPPKRCSVAGDRHPELLASRGIWWLYRLVSLSAIYLPFCRASLGKRHMKIHTCIYIYMCILYIIYNDVCIYSTSRRYYHRNYTYCTIINVIWSIQLMMNDV